MRAILTRVKSASVTIHGETVGSIGKGFLILLGVGPEDNEEKCRYLAEKALGLRVFEDENGKMNLGLESVGGQVLVVSQFTLYGNCRKGRRPSFTEAAPPQLGEQLYEQFRTHGRDCLTLMYVDVDDFKLYNQLYGVGEGDDALRRIAEAISLCVGEGGTVSRTSGKVFAVLLPLQDRKSVV